MFVVWCASFDGCLCADHVTAPSVPPVPLQQVFVLNDMCHVTSHGCRDRAVTGFMTGRMIVVGNGLHRGRTLYNEYCMRVCVCVACAAYKSLDGVCEV